MSWFDDHAPSVTAQSRSPIPRGMESQVPVRQTSEAELNYWNQAMRGSPLYQQFLQEHGKVDTGRGVKLSRKEQGALEDRLRDNGVEIPGGMHIDQGGNLNQKNRLGKYAIAGAAITGAMLIPGVREYTLSHLSQFGGALKHAAKPIGKELLKSAASSFFTPSGGGQPDSEADASVRTPPYVPPPRRPTITFPSGNYFTDQGPEHIPGSRTSPGGYDFRPLRTPTGPNDPNFSYLNSRPSAPAPSRRMVPMQSPTGSIRQVPADQVAHWQSRGAQIAQGA